MASYTGARSYHKTLTGTTVDSVALTNLVEFTVMNKAAAGGTDIYFTFAAGSTPSDPTAAGNGTYYVPPGGFLTVPYIYAGTLTVKVLGNGNAYGVESR